MEAVKWVEKIRVNPGNYADKKKFNVREYSDADYERELQRLRVASADPERQPPSEPLIELLPLRVE